MTKAISRLFWLSACITTMLLLMSCVRTVPLDKGIVLDTNSTTKLDAKVLVSMDRASSEKVVIFKPGPFADKFSLKAGESIKSNILAFVTTKFQQVDFVNNYSEATAPYDYYLTINWKDHKIDMGNSIFSNTKTNIYIDYKFMNSQKEALFTSVTDGNSVNRLSGGEIVSAINPFVFIGTKRAENLIANSWNDALANSISAFDMELEKQIK